MDRGLLAVDGRMAKVSWDWMVLAIVPYYLMWVLIGIKRENLGNPSPLPNWYEGSLCLCFTVFSVAILFLILAYFLRFAGSGKSVFDPMQSDAYGMFLVHYPIALWLQYWLFNFNMPATVKVPIVFVLTVAFSWALTRVLRQIPGATSAVLVAPDVTLNPNMEKCPKNTPVIISTMPLSKPCRSYRPAASSRTRC